MLKYVLAGVMAATCATAQTVPNLPQTGRTSAGAPVITKRDVEIGMGTKADFTSLQAEIARALGAEASMASKSALAGELARALAAEGLKVNHTNGVASNLTLTAPNATGGTFTGGDTSGQMVMPRVGTRRRTQADLAGDFVRPESFLQDGQTEAQFRSGAIDASPAINAAIAAGGRITLPCGKLRLDSALTPLLVDGTSIMGQGKLCTKLVANFAAGNVITVGVVGAPGNGVRNTRLGGFSIITDVIPHTSGTAITIGTHYDLDVGDIMVDGNWSDQIVINGGGAITRLREMWLGTYSGQVTGSCLQLTGYAVDTFVDQLNTNKCGTAILIDNASGIYASNMDLYGSTRGGVTVAPPTGSNVNGVFMNNVLADTGGATAWSFTGSGPITDVHLTNIWGSGSTNSSSGLSVDAANLNGLTLLNGHFHNNGAYGIQVAAGTNISLGGGTQVWNNGVVNRVGGSCTQPIYDGVNIGGAATLVSVSGMMIGSGGYIGKTAGLANCQRYGLAVSGSGVVTVNSVQTSGNVNGNMRVLGTGYTLVQQVIGFATKNNGAATIPTGSNCAAVPLGLDASIPDASISASFTIQAGAGDNPYSHGPTQFWALPVSSGSLQVCGSLPPTSPVTFSWAASAYGG